MKSLRNLARAALAPALALAPAAPAFADALRADGDRFYLTVEVEGVPAEALLDSGAEVTIVDPRLAERVGLAGGAAVEARGTGAGTQSAWLVEGATIAALGRTFEPEAVAVIDMSEVFGRLGIRPVEVVLGRELFDAGRLAIDLAGGAIDWAGAESPAGVRLPLTAHRGIETFPVTIDGRAVPAEFDIGNGTGLLVTAGLARRVGLRPVGVEPAGGIGGAAGREVVFIERLALGGTTFSHVRAHVTPDEEEGANVGAGLLRHFRIVTDFPGRAIWLAARD